MFCKQRLFYFESVELFDQNGVYRKGAPCSPKDIEDCKNGNCSENLRFFPRLLSTLGRGGFGTVSRHIKSCKERLLYGYLMNNFFWQI